MSRMRSVVISVALAGLVGLLMPIWFAHHLVTRLGGLRKRQRSTEIPRVDAAAVPIREVMAGGKPVIVEGLVDLLGLADTATPAGLEHIIGDTKMQVTTYDSSSPYFLYSGGYGAQAIERSAPSFQDFNRMMFDRGVADGTVVYQLLGINSLGGTIADVLERFDHAVSGLTDHAPEPRFSGVWIGSRGAVTPLHHDAWPGLLFQTHGTKRVAMYAPADRTNLYFRNPLRGAGRWSDLPGRSGDASDADFPRLRHTIRHEGRLHSGEALYIPPFWAHEMEAIEANISVPFRFAGPRRTYLNPGFLRPASELLRKNLHALAR